MECLRRVVNSNDLNPFLSLPRTFLNRKIEILITPMEDEKTYDSSDLINNCIEDARSRYKIVNGKKCAVSVPYSLLKQLNRIAFEEKTLISLRNDSVKITLFYKGEKNIIDYKFNLPDRIFITNYKQSENKRILNISETKIENLSCHFGA